MGIRALCAAAVVAVGVGQAEAATYNVDITLTQAQETIWSDYTVIDEIIPYSEYWTIPVGETKRGQLIVGEPSDDGAQVTLTVGGMTIFDGYGWHSYYGDVFAHAYGYMWLYWWSDGTGKIEDSYDGGLRTREVFATLTLAPVPLPATAALLPLGIGALAMMRRRRRVVS